MEKDGFQLVIRKKGKRKIHHKKNLPCLLPSLQNVADEKYTQDSILICRRDVETCMFCESVAAVVLKDAIKSARNTEGSEYVDDEMGNSVIEEIVCFGLGSVTDSVTSRYQVALLLHLKDALQVENCWMYDPIWSESEKKIMEKLDLQLLEENKEGAHSVEKVTLFYMPHCGRQLFNNLFWANWSPKGLSRLILLSNSISTITDSSLDSILQKEFSFIYQASSFIEEKEIPNDFLYKDIFNDMAVHCFKESKLSQMPVEVWKSSPKPHYSETSE